MVPGHNLRSIRVRTDPGHTGTTVSFYPLQHEKVLSPRLRFHRYLPGKYTWPVCTAKNEF